MKHHSSTPSIKELRRELRQNQTNAEEVLWNELRGRRLSDCKFRRQHSVGPFIVDFYCHKYQLVIEVDGSVHHKPDVQLNDAEREAILVDLSLTILRFSNDDVLYNLKMVLNKILEKLT